MAVGVPTWILETHAPATGANFCPPIGSHQDEGPDTAGVQRC